MRVTIYIYLNWVKMVRFSFRRKLVDAQNGMYKMNAPQRPASTPGQFIREFKYQCEDQASCYFYWVDFLIDQSQNTCTNKSEKKKRIANPNSGHIHAVYLQMAIGWWMACSKG